MQASRQINVGHVEESVPHHAVIFPKDRGNFVPSVDHFRLLLKTTKETVADVAQTSAAARTQSI
jgi:hypothetical protein